MKALLRLHSYYLLNQKTQIITLIFITSVIVLLFLLTRFFDPSAMRILYRQTYIVDYTIEGFTILKIALFMIGLYTVMHLCILTPYDTLLLQRTSKPLYFLSKYMTIWLFTVSMMTVLTSYYIGFSLLIYGAVHPLLTAKTLMTSLMFITLYTLLLYAISLLTKHHLALIIVCFSFFISDIFVGFNPYVIQVSLLGYIINVLAPNLHILTESTIDFVFPLRMIAYLIILYLLLISYALLTYEE